MGTLLDLGQQNGKHSARYYEEESDIRAFLPTAAAGLYYAWYAVAALG
jgi:hypothetical protein